MGHAVFRVPRPRRIWLQFSSNKQKFVLVFNAARDASKNRARILFVNAEFQTYPDKEGSGWNSHCLRKSSLVFNASRDSTNPGAVLSHWGRLTISRPRRIWLHSHWIRESILVFNAARDASKHGARILFVNAEFQTYQAGSGWNSHCLKESILVFNASRGSSTNEPRIFAVNDECQSHPEKDGYNWNSKHIQTKKDLVEIPIA